MQPTASCKGHEGNNLTKGVDQLVIHSILNSSSRLLYSYRCAQNTEFITWQLYIYQWMIKQKGLSVQLHTFWRGLSGLANWKCSRQLHWNCRYPAGLYECPIWSITSSKWLALKTQQGEWGNSMPCLWVRHGYAGMQMDQGSPCGLTAYSCLTNYALSLWSSL